MPSDLSKREKTHSFSILASQSRFVTTLCLASLLAIWQAKLKPSNLSLSLDPSVLILVLITLFLIIRKNSKLCKLAILILLPLFLYLNSSKLIGSLMVYEPIFGQKVELFGTVQDDAAYNNYGDYEFNITDVNFAGGGKFLPGRIRIRTKLNTSVYRGDRLFVSGTIKPALGARTGSISYAEVEVIRSEPSSLEQIRLKFFQSVYSSLPEPHASLGIGFLAGVRSSIPKDLQDRLSRVGLTHIIAVSGYNLTILVMAISRLGKKLSKYQKLILSLSLIFTFLLITGFSASVVRAALVSLISLSCAYYGRRISPLNVILITAAITASVNPVYLWEDIGWWLSFLAFFGVLILAPVIKKKIYKDREPKLIAAIVIESLSAQLLTAPLIAHIFGTFSVISLLANILVIPWIPIIMLLVFTFGVVGMVSPDLALILGTFPKIIITPIVLIINKLSDLSWASTQLKLSQFGMIFTYLSIILFIKLSRSDNQEGVARSSSSAG